MIRVCLFDREEACDFFKGIPVAVVDDVSNKHIMEQYLKDKGIELGERYWVEEVHEWVGDVFFYRNVFIN